MRITIRCKWRSNSARTMAYRGRRSAAPPRSGTLDVPIEQLAGSASARIRVWASDGFLSGTVTSNAFSVAAQAPSPFIITPLDGATYLEGEAVPLLGRAFDQQDGVLTDTQSIAWFSDRDGALGTGEAQSVMLSAGVHIITLQATNSAALTATTQITLEIKPDYDADGIPDDQEAALGLNPLVQTDAYSDADDDGVTFIAEMNRGTELYPPDRRTEEATLREGNLCHREGITINIFLLPSWSQSREDVHFAYRLAESTHGKVFFTAGRDLDRYVLWDYLNRRREIVA